MPGSLLRLVASLGTGQRSTVQPTNHSAQPCEGTGICFWMDGRKELGGRRLAAGTKPKRTARIPDIAFGT